MTVELDAELARLAELVAQAESPSTPPGQVAAVADEAEALVRSIRTRIRRDGSDL